MCDISGRFSRPVSKSPTVGGRVCLLQEADCVLVLHSRVLTVRKRVLINIYCYFVLVAFKNKKSCHCNDRGNNKTPGYFLF